MNKGTIMEETLFEGYRLQNRLWHRLAIRSSLRDTPLNVLIRRSSFMFFASVNTFVAAPILFCISIYRNKPSTAINPAIFITTMVSVLVFWTKEGRYHHIVAVHQVLILVMPILLQFELGGIIKGGAVFLGASLCPLGAAFFCSAKTARVWFALYFLAMVITFTAECYLSTLTTRQSLLFFMNYMGVMTITFCGAFTFRVRLDTEYDRSEKLLDNVLPRSIAKRLKEGEIHIIDHFDGVTILFVDLVGFTVASAKMRPSFLIGCFLADVFSAWEQVCVSRSMEKIKTIGDAFMVVGGLDESTTKTTTTTHQNGEDTASQMVLLGLDMQKALDSINKRYDLNFKCRIGIHSGPVIAGVIGVRKFAFDVWGDAVNTASRMESHGMPGYLHMSSETYEKVKHQLSHIDIRCRGEIDVKGKGKMKTYTIKMPQKTPAIPNPSKAALKSQSLLIVPPEISMKNK